jgi:hypothetical protein
MKVRVRVGKSRIAGQGLFTAQAIHKDTRIIRYRGERISKAESAKRLAAGNVYIFTDTVGQPPSTEIGVSHMPALKAKKLSKLTREKVLLGL